MPEIIVILLCLAGSYTIKLKVNILIYSKMKKKKQNIAIAVY